MTKQENDKLNEIGRIIALAERFAAEGQMNLNKTLEALAYAQIRRAAWDYSPEITAQTMQAELAQCLEDLAPVGYPALVAVLKTGQRKLADNRGVDLLIDEAPDVFVCRTCGYATLGTPPKNCPDCGAWSSSFRKFVAFFNRDNAGPDDPFDTLSLLHKNADDLNRLAEPLSEEQLTQKPNAHDWSIREHISHFYDTQVMLDTRVQLMLDYDHPELTAIPVYEFATDESRHPDTAHEILASFISKRGKCVERLRALPLEDLWRQGSHPEFGDLTILRQAAYLAYHEVTHLPEIERICSWVNGG